jgi:hypothetical protein
LFGIEPEHPGGPGSAGGHDWSGRDTVPDCVGGDVLVADFVNNAADGIATWMDAESAAGQDFVVPGGDIEDLRAGRCARGSGWHEGAER